MKFVNPFDWLYAITYMGQYKIGGPKFLVIVTWMSIAMLLNLIVAAHLFVSLFPVFSSGWFLVFLANNIPLCGVLIMITNSCYFFYGGRHKRILIEFNVKAKLRNPYYYLPGFAYDAFSLFSFFVLLYFNTKAHH